MAETGDSYLKITKNIEIADKKYKMTETIPFLKPSSANDNPDELKPVATFITLQEPNTIQLIYKTYKTGEFTRMENGNYKFGLGESTVKEMLNILKSNYLRWISGELQITRFQKECSFFKDFMRTMVKPCVMTTN